MQKASENKTFALDAILYTNGPQDARDYILQ